jgi:predicted nuclease with RNAse H fold
VERRVLGIDLGGARMATTGYVALEGDRRARIAAAGTLPKGKTADAAEQRLLELVEDCRPSLIAIDAPLTLPPCLTCPAYCRGPGQGSCELRAAQAVWDAGGNPVTERLTEVRLRPELQSGPLPTMRIAQIAARGVALARRILAGGTRLGPPGSVQVLEVYPYASLARLRERDTRLSPRAKGEEEEAFAARLLEALAEEIGGVEDHGDVLLTPDALDALVAAYTGWLSPDGLELPPDDHNVASGWIRLPKTSAAC